MSLAVLEPPVLQETAVLDHADDRIYIPEHSHSELLIAFAVCVLSFLYLCLFRRYMWMDPDEGIILQGAQRILDGQVLYRDFFSFFTPGSYYLYALVFRLFGNSYLVAHTVLAVIGAGYSPITYLLARRVCSRQCSLLVTALMTATALPFRFIVIHNWDSTLWACLALYCAVRLLDSTDNKWAFAAGSFASFTFLTEQSKGVALVLGLSIGILLITLRNGDCKFITHRRVLYILTGSSWPFIGTLLFFAAHHAVTAMLAAWFWPVQHYSGVNRVPYNYLDLSDENWNTVFHSGPLGQRVFTILAFSPAVWISVLPLLAIALLLRLGAQVLHKKVANPNWNYYVLLSASISGLLLSVILVRGDHIHFIHLQPIFFLVFAWMLDGGNLRGRLFVRVAPVLGFCLTISLLLLGLALLIRTHGHSTIVTRRGTVTVPPEDAIIEVIQAHVVPGERILVYPYQSLYYYLTNTYSPSRYEFYQPGMHTREQVQEMYADITARPVPVVLYEKSFTDRALLAWPNTPLTAFTYDPISDYIMREYRPCATLPSAVGAKFLFMVPNKSACP